MAKIKEKYYIGRGKDEDRGFAYVYRGTKPPTIKKDSEGKEIIYDNSCCTFISSMSLGIMFVKPGEIKQLIMYTKDIKQ